MGVNKVILIGNLGRDPEVRYTAEGTAVATITLATGERRKDSSGQWVDHTEWHRLVCFGKLADFAKNYLKKGTQVYVEGRLRTNKWQDKEGKDRYTTEIVVATIQFVGSKRDSQEGAPEMDSFAMPAGLQSADSLEASSEMDPISSSFDDDDVPF